jgi:hypothetical protein
VGALTPSGSRIICSIYCDNFRRGGGISAASARRRMSVMVRAVILAF